MINFFTAEFNAKVQAFKADFVGHEELFRWGQFYCTESALDGVVAQIETIIRSNLGLMFAPPDQVDNAIKFFRAKTHIGADLNVINQMISLLEVNHEFAQIRSLFAPGPLDAAEARRNYDRVWQNSEIAASRVYLGSDRATYRTALAAYELEKGKCFDVVRAFARKLLKKRGGTTLPIRLRISDGVIANAKLHPPEAPLQSIVYGTPNNLTDLYNKMRSVIDPPANGFVQCGVLSGLSHDKRRFPDPEHYVLIFGHGTVEGKPAFLFWDPDAAHSNLASTNNGLVTNPWGPGFGCLFALADHFSTALDDNDLNAVNQSAGLEGDHLNDGRRHRYQVYYAASLPL